MAETALDAAYQAITGAVDGASALWDDRVYADIVPATIARPFVTWFWVGGGELNAIKGQDAELVITIKCVADTLAQSMAGAAAISALFNDKGVQDGGSVSGTATWQILTITQGRVVHIVEMFEKARPLYHDGHQYTFRMEEL